MNTLERRLFLKTALASGAGFGASSLASNSAFAAPSGKLVDTITNGWTTSAIPYGVALDPAERI